MVHNMTERRNKNNLKLIAMGKSLRTLRLNKNLTISQFSEQIDLSERMISNYENGKNVLSIETIVKIDRSGVFGPLKLRDLFDILVFSIYEDIDSSS